MYVDKYYPIVNDLEGTNMARIVVSINQKLIRNEGLYAPRYYSGIVDALVKFNDGDFTVLSFDHNDGQFYEYDWLTEFTYEGAIPVSEDIAKLSEYVNSKVREVVYGPKRKCGT